MSSVRLRSCSRSRFWRAKSRRPGLVSGLMLVAGCLLSAVGCAGAVEASRLEDGARRAVPVPICLKALERHGGSVVSALQPADYWSLVLPTFDAGANTVDRSAPDCSGREVFNRPELAEAEGLRSGALIVQPDSAVVTPGPDGLRILWLPTHRFPDGVAAGPLALVRPREGLAEVYATGFYRGSEKASRFALERMGARFVVTAGDEGCGGVKPNQPCDSKFDVMVMGSGRLLPAAQLALDRIEYRSMPGVVGPVQYRLTVTPVFQAKELRVVEQLTVRDQNQGVLRKSDLERVFKLQPDGQLKTTRDSLWESERASSVPASVPNEPEPAPLAK